MKYTDYIVLLACWILIALGCLAAIILVVLALIFC